MTRLLIIISFVFLSCQTEQADYIVHPPFTSPMGIPIKEYRKIQLEYSRLMKEGTLNHRVPNLSIERMDNSKHQLYDFIDDYTLLFTYGKGCGWCSEEAEKNLAITLDSLKNFEQLNFVIILTSKDSTFTSFFEKVKNEKTEIFYAPETVLYEKINASACSKYLLNKKQVVLWHGSGLNSEGRIKALENVPQLLN